MFLFIFSLILFNYCDCGRILAVLPTPSISHMVIYRPILKQLSLRGHEVVAILPDPINDPTLVNLTEIDVHNVSYNIWEQENRLAETRIEKESFFESFKNMFKVLLKVCDSELSHPQVQELINNKSEHFDLVINEWLMYASTFGFGEHFNCPIVGVSSMPLFITGHDTVGTPTYSGYVLDFMKLSGTDLTFWERVDNLLYSIWFRLFYHWVVLPSHDVVAKKHFGQNLKYVGEIEKSVSVVLVNTNPIFYVSRPLPPNFIEIGGIHKKERGLLPQHLKQYLDESSNGVLYFSLGSNVKSISLPIDKLNYIFNTLSQLPYNVLWKWESNDIPFESKNIKFSKWMPQQDVLDHPNVKLFITQGGIQSIEESIRSQVPMIGIPFAGDQDHNVDRIQSLKIGKRIYLEELTEQLLNNTIYEILSDESYKNNIVEISNLLWDQPTDPLERAIWWIEYVIRHKGAKRLQSGLVHMPWYKHLQLDILLFFTASLIFVFHLLKFVLKLYCFIFKTKINKNKKD